MKIAIAQLNYHIGNFERNVSQMLASIEQAKEDGADIVCFSELATCGYPPRDFLEFDDFIGLAEESIDRLTKTADGIAIVVGSPSRNPSVLGKSLFNSVYFLADQEIKAVQHKALLPTYDIFDEYRYFEPAQTFDIVEYKGKKIALTVCEDIWDVPLGADEDHDPMYTICPLDEVRDKNPDFVLNVSASPFSIGHTAARIEVIQANARRYSIPMFYVNHVGAQTEIIFDGGSIVMSPNGDLYEEAPYFEEWYKVFDLDDVMTSKRHVRQPQNKISKIHDALVLGVRDYFGKLGFQKAILGLSGGIDSAVTAAIATRALGKENVRVLLMPSQYSSNHSVDDAITLANKFGIQYDIVPIKGIYDAFMKELEPLFDSKPFNVTEENLQARSRGVLLMGMSNKHGHILLNTSNKSEAAVGYGTLYGDMCGGLAVIGDVYKMDVYALAEYINKDEELIPINTITKPPSAELRPDQKDSDSLPDYEILDEILYEYIENRKGPQEIIAMGHDEALVKRILRLVNINEFKRFQTAPTLRVSSKAFGMGRRMPIVGRYLS